MLHKYKERIRKESKRNFNLRSGKKAYFYLFTKYPFYYYYNFSIETTCHNVILSESNFTYKTIIAFDSNVRLLGTKIDAIFPHWFPQM